MGIGGVFKKIGGAILKPVEWIVKAKVRSDIKGAARKEIMNSKMLPILLALMDSLPSEARDMFLDTILDWVERYVENSEAKWDNVVVLPIVEVLRKYLDVPDNDE